MTRLVLQRLGLLRLLLELHLKVLATLQGALKLVTASGALQTKNHLLSGLCLLVEHGLSLTTETLLLAVVTTLTLGIDGILTLLVLGDLVKGVLPAVSVGAEALHSLRDCDHFSVNITNKTKKQSTKNKKNLTKKKKKKKKHKNKAKRKRHIWRGNVREIKKTKINNDVINLTSSHSLASSPSDYTVNHFLNFFYYVSIGFLEILIRLFMVTIFFFFSTGGIW